MYIQNSNNMLTTDFNIHSDVNNYGLHFLMQLLGTYFDWYCASYYPTFVLSNLTFTYV